jgi:hypothetical protein
MLAAGGCISGSIAVVRWPVELGAAEDAELAIDPHGETGVGLAGQLTCSLAGPKQGRRNPIKIRIVELACKTQAHRFLPSASSKGLSPPLSINYQSTINQLPGIHAGLAEGGEVPKAAEQAPSDHLRGN